MTTQLHTIGAEFERKVLFGDVAKPATVAVGLYHDGSVSGDTTAGDDLVDGDDIGAITTEPADGFYGRQSISFDGTGFDVTQNAFDDWYASVSSPVSFDVDGTTGTVDAYFVVVTWDPNADGVSEPHLYFTGDMEAAKNLGEYTTLELGSVGLSQD